MLPSSKPSAIDGAVTRDADFWVGLILICVGGFALYKATGFDASSRVFPAVVSGLLALSGLALLLRCLHAGLARPLPTRELSAIVLCVVLMGGWAAALGAGVGFAVATFALQAGLLWLSGQRDPVRLVLFAALVTAVTYLLFVMVLDVRLPRSYLSFIAPGL